MRAATTFLVMIAAAGESCGHGSPPVAAPVPAPVEGGGAAPEGSWIVEVDYIDGAGGRCEQLVGLGRQHPSATDEVFDPRMGAYEVPSVTWRWKADRPDLEHGTP